MHRHPPNSSNIHYPDVFDAIADGIFTVDTNMVITSYNQSAQKLTGISPEEAIGKQCHLIFRTSVCFNNCPVREAIKKKLTISREIIMHDQHGNMVPTWVSASVLYDQAGNICGAVESLRNLSRIYAIIDSVADGLFTTNNDMIITNFNKAAEEITGFSHDEAIGRLCAEVFHSSCCNHGCPLQESVMSRQAVEREVEIIDRNGRKKQLSVKASTLRDCAGTVIGGVQTLRDITPIIAIKEELRNKYTFKSIISRNTTMQRLFDIMDDISTSDATVLLHGESGTGKELFAHAIHNLSSRKKHPLITVNCGALPETLLESEIFGVRKGAFTGASENRAGRLQLCEGGTFFLDEIGDLPLQLQVKLLRVLENHEFQPLGAAHPIKANVRFIAATNRNLEQMVDECSFRRDLYYRLNTITLHIPPLRNRRDDIPLLVDMALERFNLTYHKHIRSVSSDVMALFLHHHFHGNIRELLNIMEQAVIMCRTQQITIENLPEALRNYSQEFHPTEHHGNRKGIDQETLLKVLAKHHNNRNAVAQELGVDRTTLWRWMKRYDLVDSHQESEAP